MILIIGVDHKLFGIDICIMEHILQYIHLDQIRVSVPLAYIVIIFWYTHLYFNYAYGVGKGLVAVESVSFSHLWIMFLGFLT